MVGGWVGDPSLVHDGMSSWAAWGGRRSAGFGRGLGREGREGSAGMSRDRSSGGARERSGALNGDWRMGDGVHRIVAEGFGVG